MLALLRGLDPERYTPLTFVVAASDRMGAAKAASFQPSKVPRWHRQHQLDFLGAAHRMDKIAGRTEHLDGRDAWTYRIGSCSR